MSELSSAKDYPAHLAAVDMLRLASVYILNEASLTAEALQSEPLAQALQEAGARLSSMEPSSTAAPFSEPMTPDEIETLIEQVMTVARRLRAASLEQARRAEEVAREIGGLPVQPPTAH